MPYRATLPVRSKRGAVHIERKKKWMPVGKGFLKSGNHFVNEHMRYSTSKANSDGAFPALFWKDAQVQLITYVGLESPLSEKALEAERSLPT
jgi:hypothetical protein